MQDQIDTSQLSQLLNPNVNPDVNPDDAAIKDKRAYYELLVRSGWFLPKFTSKFINQKTLIYVREEKIFVPKQTQVVFRLCCTPPTKQIMVDKYIKYCDDNNLTHGIDIKKMNFPDKEYLILAISTLTAGNDEIFGRNYYPIIKQPRLSSAMSFTLTNKDGMLSNIPHHLLGQKGGRSVKMNVLSKDEKMQLKMMRAQDLSKKHQEKVERLSKEIQAQKISDALFGNSQTIDLEQERARIKAEVHKELESQATQFIENKEQEMRVEFQRQLKTQIALAQLGAGSSVQEDSMASGHSTKQMKKNSRSTVSRMAPFPNTIKNEDEMGDNTFEQQMM